MIESREHRRLRARDGIGAAEALQVARTTIVPLATALRRANDQSVRNRRYLFALALMPTSHLRCSAGSILGTNLHSREESSLVRYLAALQVPAGDAQNLRT